MDESLQQLALRAFAGDSAAWPRLYDELTPQVWSMARAHCHSASDADEIVQSAWFKAFTKFHTFQPDRPFRNWIFSIARRCCVDLARQRQSMELVYDPVSPRADPVEELERADEELERLLQIEQLQECLDRLSPENRQIIAWRFWGGLSHQEIALKSSETDAAIRSKCYRSVQKLLKCMQK